MNHGDDTYFIYCSICRLCRVKILRVSRHSSKTSPQNWILKAEKNTTVSLATVSLDPGQMKETFEDEGNYKAK